MTSYRRLRVPGGCYFFTVALQDRRSDLLTREVAGLRVAVQAVQARFPFHIDAWVVLPDHLHCVWTLPEADADFSTRWRWIKHRFSQSVPRPDIVSESQQRKHERGIWQRRFWEHAVRDSRDFAAHADYVHFNPVRHGLVATAADWPFSSFRRAVAQGVYPADWAGNDCSLAAGEPTDR